MPFTSATSKLFVEGSSLEPSLNSDLNLYNNVNSNNKGLYDNFKSSFASKNELRNNKGLIWVGVNEYKAIAEYIV